MVSNYDSALDEISIFRALEDKNRAAIAHLCQWRRATSNELIVGQMETTTDVFFVVQGNLRAMNHSMLGKQVLYYDIGPGEIFGEFSAIDGKARSTDIYAMSDAFIGSITAKEFWGVLESHPTVAAALLKKLTQIARQLNERVFEYSTLAVNYRIQAELLRLAYASGVADNMASISPAPTHAAIASRVSTNRESVTKEISTLIRSGILKKEKRILLVANVERLHDALTKKLGDFTSFVAP